MSPQKTAVVTGASSGLGRAMARKFKSEGFYVVAVSRNAPEDGACDAHISADLTDERSLAQAAEEINKLERVDVFINNAGIGAYAKWDELKEDELRKLMELDFFAPVLLTTRVLPKLRESKACVVNISSAAGLLPVACMGAYSAAKAALRMFSDTLKVEERDLHVVTVFPGRISTGFGSRACGCREVPNTPSHGSETPEELAKRVTCHFSIMGGIKEHHLELLTSKGFKHIAMVTEITQAADVEAKVRQLRQLMKVSKNV